MDVSKAATKLPTLENRSLIENFIAYTQWAFHVTVRMLHFISGTLGTTEQMKNAFERTGLTLSRYTCTCSSSI